jgi:hypothetical protein
LYEVIKQWERFRKRELADGTIQVGHAKAIGTDAWMHTLFAPLSQEDLQDLEIQLECNFDESLRSFYSVHNGLKLFGSYFSIYGIPSSFSRTGDYLFQPFDFITHNLDRPDNYPISTYVVGSVLTEDVVFNLLVDVSQGENSGKIYLFNRQEEQYICEWINIFDAVNEISETLVNLMQSDGTIPEFTSWNEFYKKFDRVN